MDIGGQMRLLAVLACLLMSGCASNWTRTDTALEVSFQAANLIDAWQTQAMRKHDNVEEGGMLAREVMGKEPEPKEVAMYFATRAIAHYLLSRTLPPRWRRYWQAGTTIYSTSVVVANCNEYQLCPD